MVCNFLGNQKSVKKFFVSILKLRRLNNGEEWPEQSLEFESRINNVSNNYNNNSKRKEFEGTVRAISHTYSLKMINIMKKENLF